MQRPIRITEQLPRKNVSELSLRLPILNSCNNASVAFTLNVDFCDHWRDKRRGEHCSIFCNFHKSLRILLILSFAGDTVCPSLIIPVNTKGKIKYLLNILFFPLLSSEGDLWELRRRSNNNNALCIITCIIICPGKLTI